MIQPPVTAGKTDTGSLYTGVVLNLKAGDVISLVVASWSVTSAKVHMHSFHSFFWRVFDLSLAVRHLLVDYAISETHFALKVLSE